MKNLILIMSVLSLFIISCEKETEVYPEEVENTEITVGNELVLKKVLINHKGIIIDVSINSLQTHLKHGDTRVY